MFESARLDDDHALEGFDCGEESLDSVAVEHARRGGQQRRSARLRMDPARRTEGLRLLCHLSTEIVRKDDGVPGSMAGGYSRISGYLIARRQFDRALRGQGYGEQLLLDALGKAVAASEIGGGRLIVVDAIDDEARSFYEHYHSPSPGCASADW